MAHTFINKSQALQQTGTTINHDHTPGAAATVAILSIVIESTTARAGGDPTIDGVAATIVETVQVSAECRTEMWYVCKAFSGALFTVSVPNSGGLTCNIEVVTADAGSGNSSVFHASDALQGALGTEDSSVITMAPNAVGDFAYTRIGSDEGVVTQVTAAAGTNWDGGLVEVYKDDLGNQVGFSHYSIADGTAGTNTFTYTFSNAGFGHVGVVFKTGVAPVEETPPSGSVAIAGIAATLALAIVVPAGSVASQGYAPTIQQAAAYEVSPPVCSAVLQGYQPGQTISVRPSDGSYVITGLAPSAMQEFHAYPSPADVSLEGYVPLAKLGISAIPESVEVLLQGYTPGINVEIIPPCGALSAVGDVSGQGHGIPVGLGSLEAGGIAPSALQGLLSAPPSGELIATGYAPRVDTSVVAQAGDVAALGYAPSLASIVVPQTGGVAAEGTIPQLGGNVAVQPPVCALSLQGYAPQAQAFMEITPPVVDVLLSGEASALSTQIPAPQGSAVLEGYAPQVGGAVSIQVPTGSLSADGFGPSVVLNLRIEPTTWEISATGVGPSLDTQISGASGSIDVQGSFPQVGGNILAQPTVCIATLQGQSITLGQGIPSQPSLVYAVGDTPAVSIGYKAEPAAGVVALAGSKGRLRLVAGHSEHGGDTRGGATITNAARNTSPVPSSWRTSAITKNKNRGH